MNIKTSKIISNQVQWMHNVHSCSNDSNRAAKYDAPNFHPSDFIFTLEYFTPRVKYSWEKNWVKMLPYSPWQAWYVVWQDLWSVIHEGKLYLKNRQIRFGLEFLNTKNGRKIFSFPYIPKPLVLVFSNGICQHPCLTIFLVSLPHHSRQTVLFLL